MKPADLELDAEKLSPEEAGERWIAAGETLRSINPDLYRRTFAMVENQAADVSGTNTPEADRARTALVSGNTPEPDADVQTRALMLGVVGEACDDIARQDEPEQRRARMEQMLLTVDWRAVPVDTMRLVLGTIVQAAPIAALVTGPEGSGIADMAVWFADGNASKGGN